jgi:hypothetical protein
MDRIVNLMLVVETKVFYKLDLNGLGPQLSEITIESKLVPMSYF